MLRNVYIPNQHGAWAMLIIPFLFGMFAAEARLVHVLLFAVWLLIYLFSYPLLQWIRTRNRKRFSRPLLLYGSLLVVFGGILLLLEPRLLLIGLLYLPFFLVNIYFAKQNNERSFINDLVAVLQFSSMVYVAYWIGGGSDWIVATELFIISLVYFIGTVFYVKTMIREKNNAFFYKLSVLYHSVSIGIFAVFFHWSLLIPAVLLLVRAVVFPKLKLQIMQIGISEIIFSVTIALFVVGSVSQ